MESFMLRNFFKRDVNNDTFLLELFQSHPNEKWLLDALEKKIIDINHTNHNNDTFLMLCLKEAKNIGAKWLIEHSANLHIVNKNNKTALFIAIEKKNQEIIQEIINHPSIDIEAIDTEGRSLLQNLIVNGYNAVAKMLISKGVNLNNTDHRKRNALYDAVSYGDKSFIQFLLQQQKLELNFIDDDGNSIMCHPQVLQDQSIAKLLLQAGIDPTLKNKKGKSYLLQATLDPNISEELIFIALENGANVNTPTSDGNTIFMDLISLTLSIDFTQYEKKERLLKIVKKMLQYGGDINTKKEKNENALFDAIRSRDFELISFLLSAGIDVNQINDEKMTVFNLIIFEGIQEIKIIRELLKYGIDPNIKDHDGRTIYEFLNLLILHNYGTKPITNTAIMKKINPKGDYIFVLKEILDYTKKKASLNYLDSTGDPLFFKPLLYGHFTLFNLYITRGVNITLVNKSNHNILYAYVFKVFDDNKTDEFTCERFQYNITYLIGKKISKNYQDKLGWTILHKIMSTKCHPKLFEILTKIILFDYFIVDYQGRSVIHNAVWANQIAAIQRIHLFSPESINIADTYKLLPITYAALLGNQELVVVFLKLGSNITSSYPITPAAIKKFSPMLKNLSKLQEGIRNPLLLRKIDTLIEQIKRDFYSL